MTSVGFSHYELGKEAGRLVLEQIAGAERRAEVHHLLPELKIRGSTAPPAQIAADAGG